jgi:hypothetical protein
MSMPAFAMNRATRPQCIGMLGIFVNSAVNTSLDIPPRDFLRASPRETTMKRLRMILACLVCLGMVVVSGSAAAGDKNQGGNGASGSTTNSSDGGY